MDDTAVGPGAESSPDNSPDSLPHVHSAIRDRYEHALRGLEKPKRTGYHPGLKSLTIDERQERASVIHSLVTLGMAAEQIVDFLPTWGISLSRSTVYEYLSEMRLPRYYKRAAGEQSHHDYYTFRFFIKIAQDAHEAGMKTSRLMKGKLAWEGVRFRPDFKFEMDGFLRFIETQLSDITETLWTTKFSNYWRLRKLAGVKFRVLFIIDQKGDMAYVRRHARTFLEKRGETISPFLFIRLDDLKGSANVVTDNVWWTPWTKRERDRISMFW